MEQLIFNFADKIYPKLDLLFGSSNAELLTALRNESSKLVLIWGNEASGKSYLLDIWVKEHLAAGRRAIFLSAGGDLSFLTDSAAYAAYDYFALDNIHLFDAARQRQLFWLLNEIIDTRKHLLVSTQVPPLQIKNFQTDVRTRLGLCLIYQLQPLSEAEKSAAVKEFIQAKQSNITPEVIAYLVRYCPRDLSFLLDTISGLDEYALKLQRKITIPLLKQLLAGKITGE